MVLIGKAFISALFIVVIMLNALAFLSFDTQRPLSFVYAADACGSCELCRCNGAFTPCIPCPCGRACDWLTADYCAIGRYAPGTGNCNCLLASPGYYVDTTGSCSQTPCPRNTYNPNGESTSSSVCQKCPAGYSTRGSTGRSSVNDCRTCNAGTYSPAAGSDCVNCNAGRFCPRIGLFSETNCRVGTYSHAGARECTLCKPGTATNSVGTPDMCPLCLPGTYAAQEGLSDCTKCLPGTYSTASGATSSDVCLPCQPGTFSTQGLSVCQLCPAGYSGNGASRATSVASGCRECAPGHFTTHLPNIIPSSLHTPGTPFADACVRCPVSTFSGAGASSCSLCGFGHVTTTDASTSAADCFPCQVNSYKPEAGEGVCRWCPKNGYWTAGQTGARECTKCGFACTLTPSHSITNNDSVSVSTSSSETFSLTDTENSESVTPSPYYTRSTVTVSKSDNTPSISESPPMNSSTTSTTHSSSFSLSFSDPANTESREESRSETISFPTESRSEPTPSESVSRSRISPSFSTSKSESFTVSISARTVSGSRRSRSVSESESRVLTNFTLSRSNSSTIEIPVPVALGLSPEVQQQLKTTTNIVSAAVAMAAAPAAMSMQRGASVLALIGCPERNPTDGKKWTDSNIPFPASLIPGFGWGKSNGWFNRGAIISFFGLVVVVSLIGFLNTETIGGTITLKSKKSKKKGNTNGEDGDQNDENNNNNENENDGSCKKRRESIACRVMGSIKHAMLGEEYYHNRDDEIDETTNNNNNNQNNTEGLNQPLMMNNSSSLDSSSSKEKDENNNNENETGGATSPALKPQKVSRIPMMVMAITSVLIGMWSPQAGLLFTAQTREDLALSLAPLLAVIVFGIYICAKVHKSLYYDQQEGRGIIFVKSYILEKKCGVAVSHKKFAPKSILQSKPGRFCFLGEYFWSRPRGAIGRDAQILLSSLGPQLQKFRGPMFDVEWIKTENPLENWSDENFSLLDQEQKFREEQTIPGKVKKLLKTAISQSSDDDENAEQEKDGARKKKKKPVKNKYYYGGAEQEKKDKEKDKPPRSSVISDWEQVELPQIQQKTFDVGSYLAPHYLVLSWCFTLAVGFLQGVALGFPDYCPILAKIICVLNVLSFILILWIRPFVIPLRNYVNLILDGVVALSSILAATLLISNSVEMNSSALMDLATSLQISLTFFGMAGALVLISTTVVRFVLLRCGGCSVATQEDMWAKQVIKLKENSNSDDNDTRDYVTQAMEMEMKRQMSKRIVPSHTSAVVSRSTTASPLNSRPPAQRRATNVSSFAPTILGADIERSLLKNNTSDDLTPSSSLDNNNKTSNRESKDNFSFGGINNSNNDKRDSSGGILHRQTSSPASYFSPVSAVADTNNNDVTLSPLHLLQTSFNNNNQTNNSSASCQHRQNSSSAGSFPNSPNRTANSTKNGKTRTTSSGRTKNDRNSSGSTRRKHRRGNDDNNNNNEDDDSAELLLRFPSAPVSPQNNQNQTSRHQSNPDKKSRDFLHMEEETHKEAQRASSTTNFLENTHEEETKTTPTPKRKKREVNKKSRKSLDEE